MSDEPIHPVWHVVPSSNPVERIARALCRHEGRNPDLPVPSDKRVPVVAEDGIAELKPVSVPLWTEYAEEAKRLVVAMQAYGETES